jgi:hypothetical protein
MGILDLQRRYGNFAVQRLLEGQRMGETRAPGSILSQVSDRRLRPIQRKPLPEVKGKAVVEGEVQGDNGRNSSVRVIATQEIVPPSEQAGKFNGFPDEMTALVFAHRHALNHKRLTTIVPDKSKSFHVFETDLPLASKLNQQAIKIPGARLVKPGGQRVGHSGWYQRAKKALNKPNQGYGDLKQLIAETIGVAPGEINIISAPNSDPENAPNGAQPGRINFAPWLTSSGRTWPSELVANRTGTFPKPIAAIGPEAFYKRSPEFLRATVVHEFRHVHHFEQTIDLIKKWQQGKSKKDFHTWLSRKRKKIPIEIYAVAEKFVTSPHQSGRSVKTTEMYAHLEGFMASFHHIPEKILKDSQLGMPIELVTRLLKLSEYYLAVSNQSAKKEVEERLGRYFCGISPAHRIIFTKTVDKLPDALKSGSLWDKKGKAWVAELKKICAQKCK